MILPAVALWAALGAAGATGSDAARENRLLAPGDLEARLTGGTNVLLFNLNAGVLAQVGVARVGPGTFAAGAQLDYGVCASLCSVLGVLIGLRYEQQYVLPSLRLEYHFPLSPNPTLRNIDLYAAVTAGAGFARLEARDSEGQLVYRGRGVSPTVGAGAGLSWFFGEALFAGFELRGRIAQGGYELIERAEGHELKSDLETRWYATGVNWMAYFGVRL